MAFPPALVLTPTSRWPTRLPDLTVRTVLERPATAFAVGVDRLVPGASIIVVTFDNLVFNRLCLESILANTDYPNYEIVVVDNGSTDGTCEYLRELAGSHPHVRVLFNDHNRGFAPASNQGLALATGDVLVLLNNDTLVPRGWLTQLVGHLQDPTIGLIGPVTNRAANEAQVETGYDTYGEFLQFARDYTAARQGELFDVPRLILFCAAMRRSTYEHVGPLDEGFLIAMFEDDDFAHRVRDAGYRNVCAEDVFVHHFGQASIGHLAASGEYGPLFEQNRRRFEEKWSAPWQAHQPRESLRYTQMKDRIREAVQREVPHDAVIAVVSKGDDELLVLPCRERWHFPRSRDGAYTGYHPADSADAIAQLEALRAEGGGFLLVPATAFWWFDHYPEFLCHLESRCREQLDDRETCRIFAL